MLHGVVNMRWQDRTRKKYVVSMILVCLVALFCVVLALKKSFGNLSENGGNKRILSVPARLNGSEINLSIDLDSVIGYSDIWRGHWCPYYNDRVQFLGSRVNEVLQKLRWANIPIVHLSFAAEASFTNHIERTRAKSLVKIGNISAISQYHAMPNESYHLYAPGFEDKCNYEVHGQFNGYRDHGFWKDILVARRDYFVADFKEAAMSFVGLNAKHVFIFGEHTNMCLMHVILYCREAGIKPILVRDLVDTAWYYKSQNTTSHTAANSAVLEYFEQTFGPTVLSYDLLSSLRRITKKAKPIMYSINMQYAHLFKHM